MRVSDVLAMNACQVSIPNSAIVADRRTAIVNAALATTRQRPVTSGIRRASPHKLRLVDQYAERDAREPRAFFRQRQSHAQQRDRQKSVLAMQRIREYAGKCDRDEHRIALMPHDFHSVAA